MPPIHASQKKQGQAGGRRRKKRREQEQGGGGEVTGERKQLGWVWRSLPQNGVVKVIWVRWREMEEAHGHAHRQGHVSPLHTCTMAYCHSLPPPPPPPPPLAFSLPCPSLVSLIAPRSNFYFAVTYHTAISAVACCVTTIWLQVHPCLTSPTPKPCTSAAFTPASYELEYHEGGKNMSIYRYHLLKYIL